MKSAKILKVFQNLAKKYMVARSTSTAYCRQPINKITSNLWSDWIPEVQPFNFLDALFYMTTP